jgi:N-acetylglutamate synthase-like GNAT family acetyltransferase
MKDQLGVTIQTFRTLSKKRLASVKRFVSQCKKSDGYLSIFYWSSIEDRKNPGTNEILCYAEDEKLVAYVALYHFEAHEIEITLMIDAAYRNTAFYTLLWEQIKQAITQCPIEITRFVFTVNQSASSFKEFLQGLGARVFDCTYKLAVTARNFAKIKTIDNCPLTFRKAVRADIPALLRLEEDEFQVSEVDYKQYLLQTAEDPNKAIFIAIINEKIMGKIHVQIAKKKVAYLYDLNIDVVEQDKGYGSLLVYYVLGHFFEQSFTKVLVDAMDESNLHWYENFNFKCIATIEHWKMSAQLSPMKEREKQLDAILLNFHSQPVQDQLSLSVYKH